MYTGGVSSLAVQIASQLQSEEDPKPPHAPEKRDLVSTAVGRVEGMWLHEWQRYLPESVVLFITL